MTDADKKAFAASLTALAAVLGAQVDVPMLSAYWQFLCDLDRASFDRAVGDAGRTLKWFPKPAELRELAGAGVRSKSLMAWDAVRAAMRKHGYTHSVDFGPLVNAVIRNMGGWLHLDNLGTEELNVWGKKEFERVYDLLCVKDPGSLNGAYLRGEFGGEPVLIAISGEVPPRGFLPPADPVSTLVRELADSKYKEDE